MPSSRILAPIALAAGLGLGLSGCSGIVDAAGQAAGQAIDQAVGQVTGEAGAALGDAVEGLSGGGISLAGLPADWPAAVVVVPGAVTGGAVTPTGWTALVTPDGASGVSDAQALLQSEGFSVESSAVNGGVGAVTLQNAELRVTLIGSEQGVLYTIERR